MGNNDLQNAILNSTFWLSKNTKNWRYKNQNKCFDKALVAVGFKVGDGSLKDVVKDHG
ncbi:hypothetical protein [Burkholderia pseudomallei]|uniref:hypothetical protein n=1 Tax=Burkholderia pseudomallei TaxID=28450 RepID=UPI001F292205|nr:hypothetical protein [Burkholderia pseudomallei]